MILCQVLVHFLVCFCEFLRHRKAWKSNTKKNIWLIISWLSRRQVLVCFLLFTVETSQTLCTRKALTSKKSYLTHLFWNQTMSGNRSFSCCLLCRLLRHWATRRSSMWRHQFFNELVSGFCSFSCCLLCKLFRHWAPETQKHKKNHIYHINFRIRLCQVLVHVPVSYSELFRHEEAWRSKMKRHVWLTISWLRLRQVLVRFPVVYCANFSNIRHEKSIYFKKIISDVPFLERDCVIYLFMFQLFSANFIDSGKHEKVTWKGISDLSFRDWDGVRCSFIFLLSAVQTSQSLGNERM